VRIISNGMKTEIVKNKKVVVTGGAGFIGSHVGDVLVSRGYDVHVIDNLSAGKKEHVNSAVTLHIADIKDYKTILPIIKGSKYVFHLAALPRVEYSIEHPMETNEVNVTGTVNVLKAASEGGVKRFIYSASSSCYGDIDTLPISETTSINPKSPYGLQKYIGEEYARLWALVYGLSTVSLRYFNVFGTRQDPDGAYAQVVSKFFKQKSEGKPMTITGDGTQTRDFVHVSDVARLNVLVAEHKGDISGEFFNVGGGKNFSVKRISEMIGGPVKYIKPRLEPHETLADISKIERVLGWKPTVSFEEGIEELRKEYTQ